jgi:hypothetical protein
MNSSDLFKEFLSDDLLAERYDMTPEKVAKINFNDKHALKIVDVIHRAIKKKLEKEADSQIIKELNNMF